MPTGAAPRGVSCRGESGPAIDHDGTVGVILENWEENFAQARPYLDWPLAREFDEIRHRVLAFCRTRQHCLSGEGGRRIRDGTATSARSTSVDDPIVIFGCIEFNHRFRYGDVAADVAFLAIDLEERGFPDLAQTFVRAYGEYAGDTETGCAGLLSVLSRVRPGESRLFPTGRPDRAGRRETPGGVPPPVISTSRPHTPRDSVSRGSFCVVV